MVDLDKLALQARWASEWGRLRMAVRVGLVVSLLTLVPLVGGTAPRMCAAVGLALFTTAVGLRWWHQVGVDAVGTGVAMGVIPLAVGIVLQGMEVECGSLGELSAAQLVCGAAGAAAGVGLTLQACRGRGDRVCRWLPAILVAALTAALGCIGLGQAGVLVTLATLVTSSAVAWIPLAARARSHV